MPHPFHAALPAVLLALTVPGVAQTSPPARTVDVTNSTILSTEKQQRVKDFIRQHDQLKGTDPLPRAAETFTPGMTVPDRIALAALPEDRTTEVPQVTTYQFFRATNGIVVVDPASRRVIQVIP